MMWIEHQHCSKVGYTKGWLLQVVVTPKATTLAPMLDRKSDAAFWYPPNSEETPQASDGAMILKVA